jgi:hypothetical protein
MLTEVFANISKFWTLFEEGSTSTAAPVLLGALVAKGALTISSV